MRVALTTTAMVLLMAAGALPAEAAKFTLLHPFGPTSSDGQRPQSGLVDLNGSFYGETEFGGATNLGTVFSITTSGTETVLSRKEWAPGTQSAPGRNCVLRARQTLPTSGAQPVNLPPLRLRASV